MEALNYQCSKAYFYKSKILNPQSEIKMVYRALGVLFSDSGYSVAFSEFHENAGVWTFELKTNNSYPTGNSISLIEKFNLDVIIINRNIL